MKPNVFFLTFAIITCHISPPFIGILCQNSIMTLGSKQKEPRNKIPGFLWLDTSHLLISYIIVYLKRLSSIPFYFVTNTWQGKGNMWLKYAIGLTNFHARKVDCIKQNRWTLRLLYIFAENFSDKSTILVHLMWLSW